MYQNHDIIANESTANMHRDVWPVRICKARLFPSIVVPVAVLGATIVNGPVSTLVDPA